MKTWNELTKLFSMTLMVFGAFVITSCDKDDPDNLIVGSWQQIDSRDGEAVWTFDSDGSFSYYNPRDIDDYADCDGTAEGVWSLSDEGTILTIKLLSNNSQYVNSVFEDTHQILSVTDTQLSFITITGYTVGDTYMFSKIGKSSKKEKKTDEPANIKYGVYIVEDSYNEMVQDEISIIMQAASLKSDIEILRSQGLKYSSKMQELQSLCGYNFDKQIHYGKTNALIVTQDAVHFGKVSLYSNYSGSNKVWDSGMSSDVKYVGGVGGGIDYLQVVDVDTESFSYKVNGSKITVSNGLKFTCNTQANEYSDISSGVVYCTCHFVD